MEALTKPGEQRMQLLLSRMVDKFTIDRFGITITIHQPDVGREKQKKKLSQTHQRKILTLIYGHAIDKMIDLVCKKL